MCTVYSENKQSTAVPTVKDLDPEIAIIFGLGRINKIEFCVSKPQLSYLPNDLCGRVPGSGVSSHPSHLSPALHLDDE